MKILGIETSCDETAAAVVENGCKIVSSVVASSAQMHKKYGGIVPEVAARKQIETIVPVLKEAISGRAIDEIDALAVTVGPGLIGSLLIGIETAKSLSFAWAKPLIGVNHLVGHLYAAWINQESEVPLTELPLTEFGISRASVSRKSAPEFPAIGLVASGGHTDLVLMNGHPSSPTHFAKAEKVKKTSRGQAVIRHLGGTRDDAAGEAFDKIARMLGLGYPGGPAIVKMAMEFQMSPKSYATGQANVPEELRHGTSKFQINLPRPMVNSEDFDFSFSGLKTAVLNLLKKYNYRIGRTLQNKKDQQLRNEVAFETQEAISEVLAAKVERAVEEFNPKSVIVAGGVAANKRLRELVNEKCRKLGTSCHIPPPNLCTDNAAYIAACAFYNYSPISWKNLKANPGLEIVG